MIEQRLCLNTMPCRHVPLLGVSRVMHAEVHIVYVYKYTYNVCMYICILKQGVRISQSQQKLKLECFRSCLKGGDLTPLR